MIATFEQIQNIVLKNPNKALIEKGQKMCSDLMLHGHGMGVDSALKKSNYFENDDVFGERKGVATSNKDLIARLLQQEDMVFSAKGGSSHFSLPDSEEEQMNMILSNVRYGLSLREWVKVFAREAYRFDPMGIIFIELDQLQIGEDGSMLNDPAPYPTYKSINSIYDYMPNGRSLEYVCFQLTVGECLSFGISDDTFKDRNKDDKSDYFRFVDDAKDLIVQRDKGAVKLTTNILQKNPLPNEWQVTPAFVVSDIMMFNDPMCFMSPLHNVVELAHTYFEDRSVRNLQKKFHGFAKAVEPLLTCPKCDGSGFVGGNACPDCSIPGAEKGTGYKLKTKVSDVTRFPLSMFENGNASGFDFAKVFGYVTPDIEGWNKQDASLLDLENLMFITYWGTENHLQIQQQKTAGEQKTATEVSSNDQPKEARLNITADWAEKTENLIAKFIGSYWFDGFKQPSISYGRDYLFKTSDEYQKIYQDLRTKGAPDSALDMAFKKWKQAEFKNNPVQLVIELKKFAVEPFPHIKASEAKGIITDFNEFNCKLYFGEWASTVPDAKWASTITPDKLRLELQAYISAKNLKEPAPTNPILN